LGTDREELSAAVKGIAWHKSEFSVLLWLQPRRNDPNEEAMNHFGYAMAWVRCDESGHQPR
jgi:hypothetical protein